MYHGDVVSAFEKVRLNMIHFSIIMIPILLLFFTGLASAGTVQCGDQTWTTDGAADQKEINEAIREGDTVYLSGDFCINDPIILDSDTVLDGQGQTTITLPDNANRLSGSEYKHAATKGYAKTMIPMIRANNCKNIEIIGIHFDGNAGGQPDLITGRGFYNFIMPTGCDGISVHDCSGENSLGDFLRPIKCTNIKFYNIEAERLGHEALFAIRSSNIEMYGCKINCRINNAFRIRGSDNAYIHDNYITCTARESAGPGGQVDVIEKQEMDVEICNNVFVSTGGPGLWIVGDNNNYDEDLTDIKIHHNAFLSTGWDGRDWQGGVLTSVVHNVNIYNNVFDGCSNAGVVTYKVKGLPTGQTGADFDITVKDNIITNSKKGRNTGSGVGYGLSNTLSHSHNIISEGNVLWENAGGNYNKCSGNDLIQDPKIDPASTGWRWTGSGWECDYVSAEKTVWDSHVEVDEKVEGIDYEPVPEREFDSIFSILDVEFTDTGVTGQTADSINYEVEKTSKGKIYGGIKLIGFKDEIFIEGVPYIPSEDAVMVKYEAIKSPDLIGWRGGGSKIEKTVDVHIENETAYATLTVKMKWYNLVKDQKTGTWKKGKKHTSVAVFNDSIPAPSVLPKTENITGVIHVYPTYFAVKANGTSLTKITYEYDGNSSVHNLMVGERNKNNNGVIYTNFTTLDYWEGDIPHQADWIKELGVFDEDKLDVTVKTPYEEIKIKDWKIVKHEMPEKTTELWVDPFLGLLGVIFLYMKYYWGWFKRQ